MLRIVQREIDGKKPVTVLSLEGRLVLGEEGNVFRSELSNLLHDGKNVILNMEELTYIDPAGLGILVACFHSARACHLKLVLCRLGSKFQDVLLITKLITVFQVFDTCDEAIKHLGGVAKPTPEEVQTSESFQLLCKSMGLPPNTPVCGVAHGHLKDMNCVFPSGHEKAPQNPVDYHRAGGFTWME